MAVRSLIWVAIFAVGTVIALGCSKSSADKADLVERAEAVTQAWADQEWAQIRADFNGNMRNALSEDALADSHDQVVSLVGDYVSHTSGDGYDRANYFVVDVPMTFENGPMKMRVSYDDNGKIAGLFVLTPETP